MSGFGSPWPTVLAAAIEAGRAVLQELDTKEIPPVLVRVASYQGGRLPPPLAASLLGEIDQNEWFREKVAGVWEGEGGDAAALFLERPEGWWLDLADRAGSVTVGSEARKLSELGAKVEKLEAKHAAAVRKAKEYKKSAEDAQRSAKATVAAVKSAAEEKVAEELADASSLRDRLREANDDITRLREEHAQLLDAFASLRTRFAKTRTSRIDREQPGPGSESLPSDPVRLARMLDLQAAEYGRRVPAASATIESRPPEKRLALASGVRPDSADAVRWLIGLERAAVVLVDGYNAQFHIDRGDFTSGAARRHLIDALKRLRGASTVRHRFVVVYDSTLPGEREPRTSLGGVEVRFAPDDKIADEEILELVTRLSRVVVISSDRAVREGAEADGALVLWSEALAEWMERL